MIRFVARMVTRLASIVTLLATLAAVPAGLVKYVGWPLPDHVPSREELLRFLTSGMSDQTVLDAVAIALWLFWALFTVAVVLEAVAKIRGVQSPRIGALVPVQGLAAALIAGVTAGVIASATVAPLASTLGPVRPAAAVAAPVQEPPTVISVAAVARYDTTAPVQLAAAQHAGTVTLVIDDCGYTYKVHKGDSLWRIAKECLGDGKRWPEIWRLNKGKYWPQVSGHTKFRDPDLIFPNWVLTLPAGAVVPPGAQPTDPPITAPPEASTPPPSQQPSPPAVTQTPHQSASPTTQATPPPATSTEDSGDGVYAPPSQLPSTAPADTTSPSTFVSSSGNVSVSPSGSPTSAAGGQDHGGQTAAASPFDGIEVPGGWLTFGLGAGLVAAVAMVWRRRRQRYKPTPITSPRLDDPDLLPPLAAMTRIRTSLRRAAPQDRDEAPPPVPTVREYRDAAVKPPLPPVGPSGADLAGAAALPLSPGLGLVGEGALDAARALLVATLVAGSEEDPDAKCRAVIPAGTLATLLGVSAVELGHIERLTVAASVGNALTTLEEEIIRRSRLIADAEAADVRGMRNNDIYAEPVPQLLLITELPDPGWNNRLATVVRLGHSVDIGAVIIGDWPSGTTLTVAADGTTGTDDTPRLAVLNTTAAIDMLGLLREAHGDSDDPIPTEQPHITPPAPASSPAALSDTDQIHDQIDTDGGEEAEPAREQTSPPAAAPTATRRPRAVIRVLGPPAIIGPGGEPMKLTRRAAAELMVLLAVNRDGLALLDSAAEIWPDAGVDQARDRLSSTVADLRKSIRRAVALPGEDDEQLKKILDPVPNTGSHYHLEPALVTVDWWTVLDEYEAVAHATDDTQRLAHLTAAIDAATGPLAEGADYDWIDTDREVVRRHRIKLHAHAAELLAHSDPHRSWLLLEQACQIDPLSDELARVTMRAAAVLGDADAIRHRLKTLREALDSNGLEIADETEELAKQLLRQLRPPHQSE